MDETGKKLLNLMFKPGEAVCVSPNKFGYHSIPLENLLNSDSCILVPTPESCEKRNIKWEESFEECPTKDLLLVALNPVNGFRQDTNVTAHRSFLIELDSGELKNQIEYIKQIGLPYSAMIFSGSKSIHTLITLDKDLPSYEVYYTLAEWILGVATMADQMTKNPTRSIRIPGALRDGDAAKKQRLVEYKGPVKMEDLVAFLRAHPDAKPPEKEKRTINPDGADIEKVKKWVQRKLINGFDPTKGRNTQWFAIACEFALAGCSLDDTIDTLLPYFQPDRDFKEREWRTTVKSAFKYIYERR